MDRTHFVYPFVDGHLSVFTLRCYRHLGTSFPVALLPHLLGIYLAMELLALHLTLNFLISFFVFSMYIRVCVWTHACLSMCVEARKQVPGANSSSTIWVWGIKFGSSNLVTKALYLVLWAAIQSFSIAVAPFDILTSNRQESQFSDLLIRHCC